MRSYDEKDEKCLKCPQAYMQEGRKCMRFRSAPLSGEAWVVTRTTPSKTTYYALTSSPG